MTGERGHIHGKLSRLNRQARSPCVVQDGTGVGAFVSGGISRIIPAIECLNRGKTAISKRIRWLNINAVTVAVTAFAVVDDEELESPTLRTSSGCSTN